MSFLLLISRKTHLQIDWFKAFRDEFLHWETNEKKRSFSVRNFPALGNEPLQELQKARQIFLLFTSKKFHAINTYKSSLAGIRVTSKEGSKEHDSSEENTDDA